MRGFADVAVDTDTGFIIGCDRTNCICSRLKDLQKSTQLILKGIFHAYRSSNRPAAMSMDAALLINRLALYPLLIRVNAEFCSNLVRRTVKANNSERDVCVFV